MKPNLYKMCGGWCCRGQGYIACAETPKSAYAKWVQGFSNMQTPINAYRDYNAWTPFSLIGIF